MLKLAFVSFIISLAAAPVHLLAGQPLTLTWTLGLFSATLVFAGVGLGRRP
jgi:hypothetical protein